MALTTMATHKRNIFEDTKEIIPWRCVPCRVICKLIKKLNPVMTISGCDWRGLGDKLKYDLEDFTFIESLNGVNTKILLDDYGSRPDASANVIYQALKEMNRIDCLNIFNEALDDIADRHSQDTQRHNVGDMSMDRHCGCFSPACPCTSTSVAACMNHTGCFSQACRCASIPVSASMSHTYPGPHNVKSCTACGCRNPNHHNTLCYCHVYHLACQMCWNISGSGVAVKLLISNNMPCSTPFHSAPCHSVPPVCEHSLREKYKSKYRATTHLHQASATADDNFMHNQVLNCPSSGQTCCEQALRQSCKCNESADNGHDHRDINNNSSDKCSDMQGAYCRDLYVEGVSCRDGREDASRFEVKWDRGLDNRKSLTSIRESLSIPQDIQPMAYNKALEHIKVFVSYSYDNQEHSKQVLILCRFIKKNGFTCNIDKIQEDSSEALEDLEKCKTMVANADIVLFCISDKYLEDIASPKHNSSSKTDRHQLHNREIYDILNSQRFNNQNNSQGDGISSPHIISLMFPHLTHRRCPRWLMSGPIIVWPDQFRDLVRMIVSKAEVRDQDI